MCPPVSHLSKISFNYSAEKCQGPTDLVNKYVKSVNRRAIVSQIFFKINILILAKNQGKLHTLLRLSQRTLLNLQKILVGLDIFRKLWEESQEKL